ncbi:hypothetical protein AXK12_00020 [Cephaloticoccus capnophilus]|uniref:Uncharacterized protein n=1 Tax=Cephaloticoccus capnophilus TaxID=1548208 RepID=A0A139SRL3_9BACT|nr:efflux RND transporter periplasmic adaptor subunit [Cephaloticoccus capnophilus]KXU37172.1 hypothetical protein AXK12_00020 [Cephaloticoccus capnophilus]
MKPLSSFRLLLASLALLAPLAPPALAAAKQIYQSPMHPWITSDKPGRCTICGMPLVLVTLDDDPAANPSTANDSASPLVTLSATQHSVSGIQTAPVIRGTLTRTLRVNGSIEDDETRHRILAARVPGRVETLHVNYVGAEVRAGEPLAVLYSPEVLTAQRNYLEHLRAGEAFAATDRAAARERLLELGLTAAEIRALETTHSATALHTVRAPLSGTVVARAAYEGQYVSVNDTLFELCDLSQLWFIFDLYEPDLAWVSVGQEVEVSLLSLPGEVLRAPIAFIDPNLAPVTRTARARVVLDNAQGKLLRRQTATALLRAATPDRLLVPRTAVLQHRGEAIVFVEEAPRRYAARAVTLGQNGEGQVEILSGLAVGERVVTEGGLILDGQAQLAAVNASHSAQPENAASSAQPDAPAQSHISPTPLNEATRTALLAAALAAADAAHALAADDLPGYQRTLPALRETSRAYSATHPDDELATLTSALAEGADLKQARDAFEPFSTALADLARAAQLHHGKAGLHLFQCPMTPVLGTGRWLSRSAELRNPFFGELMLECGEQLH